MSGGLQRSLDDMARAHQADAAAEEQMSLLDPVTPEEAAEAREELGPEAGALSVLRHARARRGPGRPKNARNKRTDDLARYLLQFGEDPLVGAIRLASTDPLVLMEASRQEKVHSFSKHGEPRIVVERMSYSEAMALIMRARELAAPYIHGKKPVAIVHDFSGLKDLVIEGVTHSREEVEDIVDADFLAIEDRREEDGGE